MTRVLFFAPRDCRPSNTGAKLRNFHLSRELAREATVTYLCFEDTPGGAPQDDMAQRIITVPHQGGTTPLKLARGLVGRWPLTVLNYTTPAMQERLTQLLQEEFYDIVQVESLLLAAYLPLIRQAQPNALLVCDWHNVDSEVLERYAEHAPNTARRIYALATARRLAKLERQSMSQFDAHLTVSDRDRDQLLTLSPNSAVYTIENGADTAGFDAGVDTAAAPPHRLIFVGSMDYHPNIDASQWFAHEVWPQVRKERPDWVFTIVGRNPAPALLELAQLPGIEVTGTVPDVRPYYREAVASVVPLRVGGGSRLKILEAMAARVPVVSTTLGAEGLAVRDGETIIIQDEPAALGQALLDLARDETRRQNMVDAAHALAVKRYDWTAVGAQLRAIHGKLLESRYGSTPAATAKGSEN